MSSTCIYKLPLWYSPTQKNVFPWNLWHLPNKLQWDKKINSPFWTSLQSFIDWNSIYFATRQGKTLSFPLPQMENVCKVEKNESNNFPLHSRVFRFVKWKNDEWLWKLTVLAVSRTIWLRVDLCHSWGNWWNTQSEPGEGPGRRGQNRPGQVAATRSITFLITKIPEVINFACIT